MLRNQLKDQKLFTVADMEEAYNKGKEHQKNYGKLPERYDVPDFNNFIFYHWYRRPPTDKM